MAHCPSAELHAAFRVRITNGELHGNAYKIVGRKTYQFSSVAFSISIFCVIMTFSSCSSEGRVCVSRCLVDPHYLEHPDDVKTLIEGCKLCDRLATKTKALGDIAGTDNI